MKWYDANAAPVGFVSFFGINGSDAGVAGSGDPDVGHSIPGRDVRLTTGLRSLHPCSDREGLYAELAPLVSRLVRQYGQNDRELRQDLTGEIYCRFCAFLDAYDPARGVPVLPYLIRQLTASVYSFVRQHRIGYRREVSLDEGRLLAEPYRAKGRPVSERALGSGQDDAIPAVAAGADLGADPTPTWDEALVRDQLLNRLPELIAALPRRQQQVVIARYYEQRSFDDIASALGVQPASARSLLRHGLTKLRRALGTAAG